MLDVVNSNDNEGEKTIAQNAHSSKKASQTWKIMYLDKMNKTREDGVNENRGLYINRPFFIQSRMWMNRLITVQGNNNLVITSKKVEKDEK